MIDYEMTVEQNSDITQVESSGPKHWLLREKNFDISLDGN